MNEYKTIDSLFKKFANPIKEDYEALAVSLMKNFSIAKCEKDSEGVTRVRDKDCVKNRVKRANIVRSTLC